MVGVAEGPVVKVEPVDVDTRFGVLHVKKVTVGCFVTVVFAHERVLHGAVCCSVFRPGVGHVLAKRCEKSNGFICAPVIRSENWTALEVCPGDP